jgi:hypothetical protein
VIYFDTFPDHGGLDPVERRGRTCRLTDRLRAAAARLRGDPALADAIARQDAASALRVVSATLYR